MSNPATAMKLARAGLFVLPCDPATKAPRLPSWTTRATNKPNGVRYYWERYGYDSMPGIAMGLSGLGAVDIDVKNGIDGHAAMDLLLDRHGELPLGPTTRTPSGGTHCLFRQPTARAPIGNATGALPQLCLQNRFDPVLDYLDGLAWDGKPRLEKWFIQYLGAEDTELNRVVSRLSLVAAVRRARQPGCKFDQIIVLEGQEGTQKSTAIATMAGEENFSDQTILGLDDRAQMERLKGKWIYEIADLAGMKRSEVEVVKAFASRTADRARPAYGRHVVEQPRRCVLFATTNDDAYLKSQTGNRRFWPVKTGRINLEALRRDRDQLWAEAAKAEATGESIALPERMWAKARVEQDKRLEHDPWDDILDAAKGEIFKAPDADEERIASCDLLLDYLKIPAERATKEAERKLAQCMRRLGWDGPKKMRIGGKPQRGYHRFTPMAVGVQAGQDTGLPPWKR